MLRNNRQQLLLLLQLAMPLVLTGLVQSSSFYFETLFLAKLGIDVLAAGTLVGWLAATFWLILFGALAAINILVANFYGEKNHKKIKLVLKDGIQLCLIVAPLAMLGFWYIADVLYYFGQSQSVIELSRIYLRALIWGMIPSFINTALIEFIVGLGKGNLILRYSIMNTILVILFSYLFIFGAGMIPALGIQGAGLGFSVSAWMSLIFLMFKLLAHEPYKSYFVGLFDGIHFKYLKDLIRIGMPIGLMYGVEVAFFLVLNIFMGSLGGNSILAANQVVLQYLGLFMSIIFSIAQAITIRLGHLYGEKNVLKLSVAGHVGIIISLIVGVLSATTFLIMPEFLIGLDFDVSKPQNLGMVQFATQFFFIAAFFLILESIRVALFGILRALRQTHFTLFVSVFSFWLIALPLGYYFAKGLNLGGEGFWYAMIVGALSSIIVLYWRFKRVVATFY